MEWCQGDPVRIGPSQIREYSYSWSPTAGLSNPNIANPLASPDQMTTYQLTLTNELTGCSFTRDVEVTVYQLEGELIDLEICKGESINIGIEPEADFDYLWSPAASLDDATAANPLASPDSTTLYALVAENQVNGCVFEREVLVSVFALPPDDQFQGLKAWYFENELPDTLTGNPVGGTFSGAGISGDQFDPAAAGIGTHRLTYSFTNHNGCTDSVFATVEVIPAITVYQVLTPNGDGDNGVFYIESLERAPNHELQIFNRWGNLVFESTNYQNDWDGEDLPDGSYYYVFKAADFGLTLQGGFIIMR